MRPGCITGMMGKRAKRAKNFIAICSVGATPLKWIWCKTGFLRHRVLIWRQNCIGSCVIKKKKKKNEIAVLMRVPRVQSGSHVWKLNEHKGETHSNKRGPVRGRPRAYVPVRLRAPGTHLTDGLLDLRLNVASLPSSLTQPTPALSASSLFHKPKVFRSAFWSR